MKLQREFAICALDFNFAGATLHAEHFVIVAFSVASQNGSKSFRMLPELVVRIARDPYHGRTQ
jgi:hypothetical protein